MNSRGLLLMLIGAALIVVPVMMMQSQRAEAEAQGEVTRRINLVGQAQRDCDSRAFETAQYRVGCQQPTTQFGFRRQTPPGTGFVHVNP
jgi:type II secretory pathway pseudopilin PulG